jgi:hypothetical protein
MDVGSLDMQSVMTSMKLDLFVYNSVHFICNSLTY